MGKGPGLIYKTGLAKAVKNYNSKKQPEELKEVARFFEHAILTKKEFLQMLALEDYLGKKADNVIQSFCDLDMMGCYRSKGYDVIVFLDPKAVIL